MPDPLLTLGENFWTVQLSKAGFSRGDANPPKVSVSFTTTATPLQSDSFPAASLRELAIKGRGKLRRLSGPGQAAGSPVFRARTLSVIPVLFGTGQHFTLPFALHWEL